MRNFSRGYKNNNGGSNNFSRNDRRGDRDNNFRSNDSYKRPSDRGFNRFNDNKKPRRDFDAPLASRGSYNQDRRDSSHIGGNRSYGGNDRSFQDRSFRDQKSYRNHTPPRHGGGRDFEGHSDSRHSRSSDTRFRRPTPPPATSNNFHRRNDFQSSSNNIRPRPTRGGISSRRGLRPAGNRLLHRSDLRSGLISKRSLPTNRSKEYIKKIKQARLKLNDKNFKSKADDEPKTPPKESEKDSKNEDIDEDFLDVANDVNFEEDEDDGGAKNSSAAKADDVEKSSKDEKAEKGEKSEKAESENMNASASSHSDKGKRREKSVSKDAEFDLTCVHCLTKSSSIQDFRYHLKSRSHMIGIKKVSVKARMTLNRLRKVQRDRQLEIEARLKNVENIPSKYCQICKLYFRQSKIEHRESEDHKKIRNFLKPYCKICHVQLLSAVKYEIHRCTVEHLRKKAKKNETIDDEIDMHDIDLGDFKTLDSIGTVDADGDEVESSAEVDEFDSNETSVGQEYVNKIEVNYCSLCREYLSRSSKDEKIIADHCKKSSHLRWYYQCKKKDEKEVSNSKAKSGDESAEAKDLDVSSTSAQDGNKTSKKQIASGDNDVKVTVEEVKMTDDEKNDSTVEDEASGGGNESSKKFTRYFEQPN